MTRFDSRMSELSYSILHDRERVGGDTEPRIQELERSIGSELPSDYREFLAVYGGATFSKPFEAPIAEPGHFDEYACPTAFLGFYKPNSGSAHALDVMDGVRYYKNRVPKGYIPIAQAIGGNLILLGVETANRGKVLYWDHETSDVFAVADSFSEFLSQLTLTDEEDEDDED